MIRYIYLDMDDVLNRFTMQALHYAGLPVDPHRFDQYPVTCKWNIIDAANVIAGEPRFTEETFWPRMPRHFWAELPKSNEFDLLIAMSAELVGRENVFIATSPVLDPDCAAAKMEWIDRNCPPWLHRQFFITPRKWMLANDESLLFDDADINCEKWREHGGHAICVPRPWNSQWHSPHWPGLETVFKNLAKWNEYAYEANPAVSGADQRA